ncbi:MAG: hypothetical protein OXB84_08865 [Halobacteriovoraceae bacterium]|nr:hypothetical protein [Halobacteriovoraceae bacterium]
MINRPPVVVLINEPQKTFTTGKRQKVAISEKEIATFVKKFIDLRYRWEGFNSQKIVARIAPLSTKSFKNALLRKLNGRKFKKIRTKKISQIPIEPKVYFSKGKVIASFDKLVKMDGVSLVAQKQVLFILQKGNKTPWNPMGIYIDGVVEHEQKN